MTTRLVRRGTPLLALAGLVAALTACEDARVKAVDTGMTRDQVLSQLAKDARGAGPDSTPNVYTKSMYIIDGQQYEVFYFTKHNEKITRDTVEWDDLTPIVMLNNKVIGKGWDYWDSAGKALKIQVPKHED